MGRSPGHDGVWNLFEEIGSPASRLDILDWYHLRENLYKVGGSLKRLKQAEAQLWQGQVDEAIASFTNCRSKQAYNFCAYLTKHRHRLVNYKGKNCSIWMILRKCDCEVERGIFTIALSRR